MRVMGRLVCCEEKPRFLGREWWSASHSHGGLTPVDCDANLPGRAYERNGL